LTIQPSPGIEPITAWTHAACLDGIINSGVQPDDPKNHGRIPPSACCVFCGDALPIIGAHAWVVDLGECDPPRRFWSHPSCLTAVLTIA
jgi:hypothetical protein